MVLPRKNEHTFDLDGKTTINKFDHTWQDCFTKGHEANICFHLLPNGNIVYPSNSINLPFRTEIGQDGQLVLIGELDNHFLHTPFQVTFPARLQLNEEAIAKAVLNLKSMRES